MKPDRLDGSFSPGTRTSLLAGVRRQLSVIALVITAVGVSVLLIPGPRDQALQDIAAGRMDSAIARLEARVASGDRSPSTFAALARARVEMGDLEGTILDLKALHAERPSDLAVLDALAGYYLGLGRTSDYVDVLEQTQILAPSYERQRDLARLYGELGREADQKRALLAIIGSSKAIPADYQMLANLLAASGEPAAGASILRRLSFDHPNAVTTGLVASEIVFLLSSGAARSAVERAREWLRGRKDLAKSAPSLASVLSTQGRPDLAADLLQPLVAAGAGGEVVVSLAEAYAGAGNLEAGARLLETLNADPRKRAVRDLDRLRAAMALRNVKYTLATARRIGMDAVPSGLLPGLADAAIVGKARDVLQEIRGRMPETVLSNDPILAARICLMLGESDAARRWSEQAAGETWGDPQRAISLAYVELRLARPERALAALRLAFAKPLEAGSLDDPPPSSAADPLGVLTLSGTARVFSDPVPRRLLDDVAQLYIRLDRPREGWLVLNKLRERQPSLEADLAWARAGVAAGRPADISDWLAIRDPSTPLPAKFLKELSLAAFRLKAFDLAAQAATQLMAGRGNEGDRLLLAEARAAARRPWTAPVQALRPDASTIVD